MANDTPTSAITDAPDQIERDPYLDELLAITNRRHYQGAAESRIAWGVPRSPILMEQTADGLPQAPAACWRAFWILIHPALRRMPTPRYVLVYLIWHELLHEIVAESTADNPHPPELMAKEANAPHRERAQKWLVKRGFPALPLEPGP